MDLERSVLNHYKSKCPGGGCSGVRECREKAAKPTVIQVSVYLSV